MKLCYAFILCFCSNLIPIDMVILIDDKKFEFTNLSDFFRNPNNRLKERSKAFASKPPIVVTDDYPGGVLFAFQKESVSVNLSHSTGLSLIGSDEATTCVMVVMECLETNSIVLGHLDGIGTEDFFDTSLNYFAANGRDKHNIHLKLHLVGGFMDKDNTSRMLVTSILKHISLQACTYHLETATVFEWNSVLKKGIYFPIVYGVAYNTATHKLSPADFQNTEPYMPLRFARVQNTFPDVLYQIYDDKQQELVIEMFDYRVKDRLDYIASLAVAPDDLLKYSSTSPEQEKANYIPHVRAQFAFMRDNPDPLVTVFHGKDIRLKLNKQKHWIRVE